MNKVNLINRFSDLPFMDGPGYVFKSESNPGELIVCSEINSSDKDVYIHQTLTGSFQILNGESLSYSARAFKKEYVIQ